MRSLGSTPTLTVDNNLKTALTTDFRTAAIDKLDMLILTFADKVTREAHSVDQAYIDFLKSNGFDDRMIHDTVQSTAYFNYVNRLADGLGVELEADNAKR